MLHAATQLTISTMIAELHEALRNYGDLPVVLIDADTGWIFKLKAHHLTVGQGSNLSIEVDYSNIKEDLI